MQVDEWGMAVAGPTKLLVTRQLTCQRDQARAAMAPPTGRNARLFSRFQVSLFIDALACDLHMLCVVGSKRRR